MIKRRLGQSDIIIPPLMLGGNVFGWTADKAASFRILDAALDAGLNAIDTADAYSSWVPGHRGGESESLIGEWLAGRGGGRDRVVIATKVGLSMGPRKEGLSRAYIREAVEASLLRLRTEVIDLYQAHRDDEATPLEETLHAFAELIAEGKVRAIGASNYSAARLTAALDTSRRLGLPRYESLQPLYNLVARKAYEAELEPVAATEGLGVIPFYGLAAGFLTGKYRSEADLGEGARSARVRSFMTPRNLAILAVLSEVAEGQAATPAQVALAWQMTRPSITAPIASATSADQVHDIARAVTLQLTPAALARLDAASDPAADD